MSAYIKKILLDTHMHTIASGHAYSTIGEYINQALAKNLELIAITDHGPSMGGSSQIYHFGNLRSMAKKFGTLEVLYGAELNITSHDGDLDLPMMIINTLDLIIASLHRTCIEDRKDNTEVILKVMNNPCVNIFGHLGDPRYLFDVERVIHEARETKTIIEINNGSLSPNNARYGGNETIKQIIRECKKISWPVILNSDAHFHLDLANLDYAQELIQEQDMPDELVLNTSVKLFKSYLSLKKTARQNFS